MKISIVSNNQTNYKVVLPQNPHIVEETAADELVTYFKKVFGIDIAVAKENEFSGKGIFVGRTAYAEKLGISGDSKENWIIKMQGENLVLTGGTKEGDRGILYSVYHFLEDIIGVRWWNRWQEYIPEISDLELEDDFLKAGTPAFSYRKILGQKNNTDYKFDARTRANIIMEDDDLEDLQHNESVIAHGGAKHMGRPNHVHSFSYYFDDDTFEKHPEWYAWNDILGRRIKEGHMCLTNDELCEYVLNKLTAYIEDDLRIEKETGVEIPCFYSLSFADTSFGFCNCEKCKAVIEKSGVSGYSIQFINKIARAIAPKYPRVKLETLAYSVYKDIPKDDTLPEKNVIIRIAHLDVDIIHGITEKGNKEYIDTLKGWSEIREKSGCGLYIWEYMYNFFMAFPLPIAYRLCDTFRAFKDYGVDGIFVENQSRTTCLWELNEYMLLHLCEDPYADEEYLINDFMTKFYGDAAQYMRAYLDEIRACAKRNEYSVYCIIEGMNFNYLDVKTLIKCEELLKKAREAVKGNDYLTLKVMWEQKMVATQIFMKYRDLKKQAQREGIEFNFTKEELVDRILSTLEIIKNTPNFTNYYSALDREIKYFQNLDLSEEPDCVLPKELEGVNPEDVYQYHFKNQFRHYSDAHIYAFSIEEDKDSTLGRVGYITYDKIPRMSVKVPLTPSAKNAENPNPVKVLIEQNGKIVDGCNLYLEDIASDEYKLYKIGSVSGIKDSFDTRVNFFNDNFDWVSLTGVSVVFPMDACDVYMSVKFAGEIYGGNPSSENSVSIDRVIIVRKG